MPRFFSKSTKALLFVAFLIIISGTAYSAGIDSEGTELPLNAGGVHIATLKATSTNTGKMEVLGELNTKGVISAESGLLISGIGNDADTDCSYPGLVRYNSTKHIMQYCDGSTSKWAALSIQNNGSFSGTCPYTVSELSGWPPTLKYEVGTPVVMSNSPACYCVKDTRDAAKSADCASNRYTHFSFACESPNPKTGACSCAEGTPVITSYNVFGIQGLEGYKSATYMCQ